MTVPARKTAATARSDELKKRLADMGIQARYVPADPKAPVNIQVGGRPKARDQGSSRKNPRST